MMLTVAPVSSAGTGVSVPLDDVGGLLVVSAKVNGKGPFHFLLDTGAGITVITPQLAHRLSARSQGSVMAQGVGGASGGGMLELEAVSVGRAVQNRVASAVLDLPPGMTYQGRYGSIDGILGYSFLNAYAVTIDVKDRRATFASHARSDRLTRSVPMAIESSIPVADVCVNGTRARMKIDSGNNGNASLTTGFTGPLGIPEPGSRIVSTQYAGVGGAVSAQLTRLRTLAIGGLELHAVPVTLADADGPGPQTDGDLGYDFLKRFIVTFDYPHGTLLLKPVERYDALQPVIGTGIVPSRRPDGTFVISAVLQGSAAMRAGLREGDVIEAVNGRSTRSMSLGEFKLTSSSRAGQRVALRID